ncbi:coiled-coil domain-containing protein 55-domain containing protein [Mortierella sp. GBAus27b]|nr:hypothetical protein BGX31_009996 [Mortierella sp. GBA43]KAI8352541.1 coiled-coil domain-containing protein 55-domain containing protein [Mortierella sp. GBAus27b]
MSGIQFGLNVKKKGPALGRPKPPAARPAGGRSAFGGHSSDEDNLDEDDEGGSHQSNTSSSKPKPTPATSSSTAAVNKTLRPYASSTLQSTAVIELQNEALAQDATVFDYDGVYDQLKAGDRAREIARKQQSLDRKPKYIGTMLEAAETRKRDRQIADEKRIERERELEGDEFKDKDMFITPAYKAQKEAARLAEEEERKKEEMLAKDEDGSLMRGFYRSMLDERTKLRSSDLSAAAATTTTDTPVDSDAIKALEEEKQLRAKEDAERASEARELGLKVVLNDDGKIVDKRELLKGGLNIVKKSNHPPSHSARATDTRRGRDRDRPQTDFKAKYRSSNSSSVSHGREDDRGDPSQDQRTRMTEKIEKQLLEQQKQAEEEEKQRQEAIRVALKRKNEDNQVMDAKARYLARKAAAAGKTDS